MNPVVGPIVFIVSFSECIDINALYSVIPINKEIISKFMRTDSMNVEILRDKVSETLCIKSSKAKITTKNRERAIDVIHIVFQYAPSISISNIQEVRVEWSYSLENLIDYSKLTDHFKICENFRVTSNSLSEIINILEIYCVIKNKRCMFFITSNLKVLQVTNNSLNAQEGFNKFRNEILSIKD